jgi:transposase
MQLEQQKTRNEIIVNMSNQGHPQHVIAKAVGLAQSRISQLLKSYRESPGSFFDNHYQGKPPKLDAVQAAKLDGIVKAGAEAYGFQGDVWTAARIKMAIKETFDIEYHEHHIAKMLKKMGFTLQKPKLVDSRQSPEKVSEWREKGLPEIKKKR